MSRSAALIGAITASNELPDGEDSAAIYDRLLVRIEVTYLEDPSNFAALVRSAVSRPAAPKRTTVDLAELRHAVAEAVPAVEVPDGIVDAVCTLRAALRRKELIASDRRWRQAVGLLQASAYLDGRPSVAESDLSVLTHVLWNSPPSVRRSSGKYCTWSIRTPRRRSTSPTPSRNWRPSSTPWPGSPARR